MRLSLSNNWTPAGGTGRAVFRRGRLPVAALLALAGALSAGGRPPDAVGGGPAARVRARHLMGTRLTIEVAGPAADETVEAAFDEVGRLEEVMSNWRESSELSRLNRDAAAGWVRCSPDLFAALDAALRYARETEGAFDPTVEPLVRQLGIRDPGDAPPGGPPPPGPPAVGPVGWRHVRLDRVARTVRFDEAGVGIDLGGIGKGIALDAASRLLKEHGVTEALLDFGGQLLAIGSGPGGEGWPVGIADPLARDRPIAVVPLRDGSLSTSGNGDRGPGRPGHILDPARGMPARFEGSVTVLAADATAADALSTALLVMGPETGTRWARAHAVEAVFFWRDAGGHLRRRATGWFEGHLGAKQDGRSAVPLR